MDTSRLGMGVMLGLLGGNDASVQAFNKGVNKTISKLTLSDHELIFTFDDGYKMKLADEGQSCCEERYLTSDDDLNYHVGAKLLTAEVKEGPEVELEYDVHETAFLHVTTTNGTFVIETHNIHNGYYGGFLIRASEIKNRA
jgi:hypothetical protein